MKEQAWGFKLAGPTVIAGNALIVGTTEDGDFTDCQAPLCLVMCGNKWFCFSVKNR